MKNLQNKTKAQLIDMLQAEKPAGNLDEFCELLKQYFAKHQSGMFSKAEINTTINKVYDAFKFAKGVRKDEED